MKLLFKNETGRLTLFVNRTTESGSRLLILGILEIAVIAGLIGLMWLLLNAPVPRLKIPEASYTKKLPSQSISMSGGEMTLF